jgi:hypothetical protein
MPNTKKEHKKESSSFIKWWDNNKWKFMVAAALPVAVVEGIDRVTDFFRNK